MGRYVFSAFFGHDASIAVVGEGKIAHLEMERFTRKKHDWSASHEEIRDRYLPLALKLVGATLDEVVAVVECGCGDCLGSERPSRAWNRSLIDWDVRPKCAFLGPALPAYYLPHHLAHAAYTFYTSPHRGAWVVALDGGGDCWNESGKIVDPNTTIDAAAGAVEQDFGSGDSSWSLRVVDGAHVGGPWGATATDYCGDYFAAGTIMAMVGVPADRFERECGLGLDVRRRFLDLQRMTTDTFHRLAPAKALRAVDGIVCLAGGCALNGIAAYDLLCREDVRTVRVPPAVHDGGLTVGAALFVLHAALREPRRRYPPDLVAFAGAVDANMAGEPPAGEVAALVAEGKTVAVAAGRAESGPRALGHRSILADPRRSEMRDRLNAIKGRQVFRPVAPVILRDDAEAYFRLKNPDCYGFMTMIAASHDRARDEIPAGIHYDGTARVQVVDERSSLGQIVAAFKAQTSCPALLNTSFNLRGEAMVNDADQARDTFRRSDINALVIGDRVVDRR